jgi:hypothetical protein
VVNDLVSEGLLGLGAASALIPARGGRRTSTATIWRWCVHGKNGIKLEHVRRPNGDYLTTAAAIGRFLSRLANQPVKPPQGQVDRQRANVEKLRAMGMMI